LLWAWFVEIIAWEIIGEMVGSKWGMARSRIYFGKVENPLDRQLGTISASCGKPYLSRSDLTWKMLVFLSHDVVLARFLAP
jgi:hypothetical protein